MAAQAFPSCQIRWGAWAAVLGGLLRLGTSFLPLQTPQRVAELLYLLNDVFLLFAIVGLYAWLAADSGAPGLTGFAVASVGILIIRSAKAIHGWDLYPAGALTFLAGLNVLVFSGCLRKRLPWWIEGALFASTLSGFAAAASGSVGLLTLSGVLFGTAFAGVGFSMLGSPTVVR